MSLIHDIHCDLDRRILQSDIPAFPLHVLVRYEICYDHRDTPEFDVVLEDAKRWQEDYPPERLQKGVEEGDAACILESCLRYVLAKRPSSSCATRRGCTDQSRTGRCRSASPGQID